MSRASERLLIHDSRSRTRLYADPAALALAPRLLLLQQSQPYYPDEWSFERNLTFVMTVSVAEHGTLHNVEATRAKKVRLTRSRRNPA